MGRRGPKIGGFLGGLGATSLNGVAWRLDGAPTDSVRSINVTEFQLGLGGGGNAALFYAFGAPILYTLDQSWGTWSFTGAASLPEFNANSLFTDINGLSALKPAGLAALSPSTIGGLSNWATALYQGSEGYQSDAPSQSGNWGTFDIPVGSCAVEFMAGMSKSQLFVS